MRSASIWWKRLMKCWRLPSRMLCPTDAGCRRGEDAAAVVNRAAFTRHSDKLTSPASSQITFQQVRVQASGCGDYDRRHKLDARNVVFPTLNPFH